MIKLLTTLLIIVNLYSSDNLVKYYTNQLNHLDKQQIKCLKQIWNKAKPFDLSYTMCAIGFKESSLGKFMFNLKDGGKNSLGSYGVFHNMVDSVYSRYVKDLTYKPINRNIIISTKLDIAKRLVDDFDFSFSQSLAELKYWENVAIVKHKEWDKWRYMIMCYNGGTYGYSKLYGKNYYIHIVAIIKAIKSVKHKYNLKKAF